MRLKKAGIRFIKICKSIKTEKLNDKFRKIGKKVQEKNKKI